MVKLEQALIIDPPVQLEFKAPFTDVTTAHLKLTNPTDSQICFKLKTTAPKTYCVRPNSGVIQPKATCSVAVMLQPFDFDAADKSKHKFMVQSMFAPDGDINFEALWRDTPAENFMNSKLKCIFIAPASNSQGNIAEDDGGHHREAEKVPDVLHAGKSSPKAPLTTKVTAKAEDENKQLKAALIELRQENSQLKEESLRWRVTRGGGMGEMPPTYQAKSSFSPAGTAHSKKKGSSLVTPTNIMICIIVLMVGIILGKAF